MLMLKPHQLTVLTTSRCTARCGHCSVRSGPKRRDQLTFEDIRTAIDELHEVNRLRVVIFAGGEPTLLGEDLLDAIAHADSLGITTRLVTNAFWARTRDTARAKLIELREAGLAELNISADDFHLPFIPFDRVENAWHASKGVGFLAVIIANSSGPRSLVTPDYIMQRLGEILPLRFDLDGNETPLADPGPDGTVYSLSNSNLQLLGRAHDTVSLDDIPYPTQQEVLAGGCPWAVRSIALSPRNHLVACCGMEAEHNAVLDFGDATGTSISSLVKQADDNVLVNAISLYGPMFLKQFVQVHAPDIPFRERYGSICELCEHIVGRQEVVKVLRAHSGSLASYVLERRAELGVE